MAPWLRLPLCANVYNKINFIRTFNDYSYIIVQISLTSLILAQISLPMHQSQKKRNLIAKRMMVRHARQMEDSQVVVGYNRVACSPLLPENNL